MKKKAFLQTFWVQIIKKYKSLEEKLSENKPVYNFLFFISLIIIFSIILFLNIKTPMNGDDYVYSFLYQTPYRLSSIHDIFQSQYIHYFSWGGRNVVHFIDQTLLYLDKPLLIDIINSCAFVLFIYVVYYHITKGDKKSISVLLMIFFLTWFLQPAFAETTLWITGSANYLWGTLIILLFLLPYRLYNTPPKYQNIIYTILMFAGGIIAGWTNENTAAAMIVMCIFFVLYYKKRKYNIPYWMYSGIVGAVIGYIIMIASPGNFARAEGTSVNVFMIAYRTLTYTHSFVTYLGTFNLITAILLILYLKFKNKSRQNIIPYIVIFLIGLLVSIYIMIASPGFPSRAWFGSITFNIIIFGIILHNINYQLFFIRQIKNSILIFCAIAFGFSFYDAYNDVTAIDHIWKERMFIIQQKQNENAENITFKIYYPKTKFGLGDTPYALKYISDYYNIDFRLEK